MKAFTTGLLLIAAALVHGRLEAASPQLSYILPPGVQRGHEHVLTFTGARLNDVEEVFCITRARRSRKSSRLMPRM
jgi:hypothetical protein